MSDFPRAVFLSYSSEDADAARRLSEALRAVGLEVWLDKNELRGGDAWDASIRKQIKECALFVPLISAHTNARAEGYFRLEWKLAIDRSHLMAEDQPFLLPAAIDDAPEVAARVPDRFREIQWSRPFGPETPAAFAERALMLLGSPDTLRNPGQTPVSVPAARPAPDLSSIAVLPFVNMSRDEDNEYFADGLSEELLNVLAKVRGLRVASRTSAFFFKGKSIDIPTIAQKLNVGTILEGSVRKAGKRVRITAQLIDVASDSHLWSETYDRELDDIFAVQDDIAQSVVTQLRAALMGGNTGAAAGAARAEVKAASTGRAADAEAYRLYLQGRFYAERMTEAGLARAVELYERAVAIDPQFALGWTGLSRAYGMQAGYGWISPVAEGVRKGREAVQRALAIDPDLAEAHASLALLMQNFDWDWKGAAAELERALRLAPGSAEVMRAYGMQAGVLGRRDEALEYLRKAVALDPLSYMGHRFLGLRCAIYGRLDEAEAELRAALDLNPNGGLAYCFLAIVRLFKGHAAEALELGKREADPGFRHMSLVLAEHTLGNSARCDEAMARWIEEHGENMGYQIAEAYGWRGDKERAFEWLERAYAQRDPGLAHTLTDPFLGPLHDDPRWTPFLRKMRLA